MIGQWTSVGLGSHARAVVACGLDGQTGELFERRPTRTTATSRRGADQTDGWPGPSAGRLRLPPAGDHRRGGRWTARRRGGCCCARGDCAGSGEAAGGTPGEYRPPCRAIVRDPTCTACHGMASAPGSGGGGRRPTTGRLPGVLCVRARSSARSHARGERCFSTAPHLAKQQSVPSILGLAPQRIKHLGPVHRFRRDERHLPDLTWLDRGTQQAHPSQWDPPPSAGPRAHAVRGVVAQGTDALATEAKSSTRCGSGSRRPCTAWCRLADDRSMVWS